MEFSYLVQTLKHVENLISCPVSLLSFFFNQHEIAPLSKHHGRSQGVPEDRVQAYSPLSWYFYVFEVDFSLKSTFRHRKAVFNRSSHLMPMNIAARWHICKRTKQWRPACLFVIAFAIWRPSDELEIARVFGDQRLPQIVINMLV